MRTGVTVVVPHGGNVFQDKVPGAVFVGNAFGKLAGSTQVDELGTIETPIALTNTLECRRGDRRPRALDARSTRQRERAIGQRAGRRNQRRRAERHSRPARAARARARGDQSGEERCRLTKAASAPAPARRRSAGRAASAPRRASCRRAQGGYTLGVLVQSNFGGVLTMGGAPVGKLLGRYAYQPRSQAAPGQVPARERSVTGPA